MESRGGARELDAAGITDEHLRASYEHCRRANARHGRSYYLATLLLPPHKRPAVHALYAFARHADDIVDVNPHDPARQLDELERNLDHPDPAEPLVLQAFRDAHDRWQIPRHHTTTFLVSMRMDLTVAVYPTDADLDVYMEGSAAAIGLQMLPVLGHVVAAEIAAPYARDLAFAFQLTNFVRDVEEDAARGRRYLTDPRAAAARARNLYRTADQGIRLLDPTSRDCVLTARRLYEGILDRVERQGFAPTPRAVVPNRTRATIAVPRLISATRARRTATTRGTA